VIQRSERDMLIEEHHFLCTRAARKFVRAGVELNDLVQIAAVGLVKAADRFNNAHGTPFAGYAWALMLGELMHYVRDSERLLRAPRRLRELDQKWNSAEAELSEAMERAPSADDVGKCLGLNAEEQQDIWRYRHTAWTVSVDSLRPHEERSLSYTIENQVDRVFLEGALSILSPIEREILQEIYERDTPVVALAKRLGYSRRHISRLHRGALKKLSPSYGVSN
jgi:RNA polymerase sigma-B factor